MKKKQFDLTVLETQLLFEAANNFKQHNHLPAREVVAACLPQTEILSRRNDSSEGKAIAATLAKSRSGKELKHGNIAISRSRGVPHIDQGSSRDLSEMVNRPVAISTANTSTSLDDVKKAWREFDLEPFRVVVIHGNNHSRTGAIAVDDYLVALEGLKRNGLGFKTEKACSDRGISGFAINAAGLQYVQQ